jgi:hypothetical protein
MDGCEYAQKILYPKWNAESKERLERAQKAADMDSITKERLKKELGIDLRSSLIEVELNLANVILVNPSNFYPELSPDYEFLTRSSKRRKWG